MRAGIIIVVVALLNQFGCTAMHMQRVGHEEAGREAGGQAAAINTAVTCSSCVPLSRF